MQAHLTCLGVVSMYSLTIAEIRMKPIRSMRYAALIAGLLASSAPAPTRQASAADQWGEVHFPVSCQASVQPTFDQAVAMLHSYSFGDAANTFATVAHDDPNCAMAYRGLATSAMGSLFAGRTGPAALGKGWDFVQQAKPSARRPRARATTSPPPRRSTATRT